MALAGFASAGREAAALRDSSPVAWAALADAQDWPSPELRAALVQTPGRWTVDAFAVLVALVLLLRMLRWAWLRRRNVVLDYPGGRQVVVPRGLTVLEASRMAGIPHAAVCGGRGRCSTCRIRVGRGADRLSPPEAGELQVLARIGAPPGVRMACQARPNSNLALTPLLPAGTGTMSLLDPVPQALGVERDLVVLFGDLRDFTRLSENRLPYDTVFVLNRYFRAMGEAFIGDGVMALFGVEGSTTEAARDGLAAARAMARALDQVNEELSFELDAPLRMGMGLHLGPVILGQIGHGRARALTAIGDTVNVASRLEALTKEVGCLLIVSDRVLRAGNVEPAGAERREIDLRGRDGRLAVWLLSDLSVLPSEPASRGRKRRRRSWPLAGWA
jgi:adenylate cyclase